MQSCSNRLAANELTPTSKHQPGESGREESGDCDRLRSVIEDIVAHVFCVEPGLLRQPTRGRANVALARQVAMYVAHVAYGMSLTDVGDVFDRDRTTVSHACAVVEQRREDEAFDRAVVLIENITRAMNGPARQHADSGLSGWRVTTPTV